MTCVHHRNRKPEQLKANNSVGQSVVHAHSPQFPHGSSTLFEDPKGRNLASENIQSSSGPILGSN